MKGKKIGIELIDGKASQVVHTLHRVLSQASTDFGFLRGKKQNENVTILWFFFPPLLRDNYKYSFLFFFFLNKRTNFLFVGRTLQVLFLTFFYFIFVLFFHLTYKDLNMNKVLKDTS